MAIAKKGTLTYFLLEVTLLQFTRSFNRVLFKEFKHILDYFLLRSKLPFKLAAGTENFIWGSITLLLFSSLMGLEFSAMFKLVCSTV